MGTLVALRRRPGDLLAVLAPPAVAAIGLVVYSAGVYGSLSPNAAYRSPPFPPSIGFSADNVWSWTLGDLLNLGL